MGSDQRRHEAPDVGDAIVRMLRGLVTRAAEGDTEAVEQLARIGQLVPVAVALGGRLAHDCAGYSYTELGRVLGVSRQAARQRAMDVFTESAPWSYTSTPDAHQLVPGHTRRGCEVCHPGPVPYPADVCSDCGGAGGEHQRWCPYRRVTESLAAARDSVTRARRRLT